MQAEKQVNAYATVKRKKNRKAHLTTAHEDTVWKKKQFLLLNLFIYLPTYVFILTYFEQHAGMCIWTSQVFSVRSLILEVGVQTQIVKNLNSNYVTQIYYII